MLKCFYQCGVELYSVVSVRWGEEEEVVRGAVGVVEGVNVGTGRVRKDLYQTGSSAVCLSNHRSMQ